MTTPTIITRLWDLFLVDNYNTPTHINQLIAPKSKTTLLCKEENGKFLMCPYLFQNYHYRINLLCFYAEYLQVSPKGYPPRVKNRRKPKSRREYRLSGSSLSLKKPFTFIAKQIYFLTGNRYIISVYRFHQVILWLKPNTPLFFKESFYDCPLRYQLEPLQHLHYWHYSAAGQASSLHREFRH